MKKFFAVMMSLVLVAGVLVGCGPKDEPQEQTKPAGETAKPAKLVVWEDKDKAPGLEPAIKSFEEKYGIKVEFKELNITKVQEQLRLDGPAGKGPDVITLTHDGVGPSVTQGLIAPLNVEQGVTDLYTESSLKAMTFNGQLYGLPKATETPVFIYNKKLMPKAPATFDELYTFSKDFTKNGNYGFLALWDNYYFAHGVIGGYGGYVFGEKDGIPNPQDVGLSNKESVQGLEYIQKWYKEGLFPTGLIGEQGGQTMDGLFSEGKVGAVMNGPWAFQSYKDAGIDYGVAAMPTLPNGKPVKTFMGVKGWFVTSFSKNQEWSNKLVEWLANAENAKIRFEKTGEIPPVKALMEDPVIANNEGAKAVALQSQYAEPMPNIPEMAEVWEPMAAALQLTVTNKQAPQKALDDAVKTIGQKIQTNHAKK